MSLQWLFPRDTPGDGMGTAQRPVAIVTAVDVAAGPVDGFVGDVVSSPDWMVSGPGEVSDGRRCWSSPRSSAASGSSHPPGRASAESRRPDHPRERTPNHDQS